MKIIVFAYHDIGCQAIETLAQMGHEIGAVFTHEDDAAENLWFGSVKKTAEHLKIPVYNPENVNDSQWIIFIKNLKPDLILSFYYRQIICDCILAIPSKGAYNLHGSLLPKYRGRAPINWAILKGETETGLTLHKMVKKPDAGDILSQKKVIIESLDNAQTVFKKMVPLVREILLETMPKLENGTASFAQQNHAAATYFGGRKPDDGRINWASSALQIYNLIRAVTHPYPGAFTVWNGKKIYIWQAALGKEKTNSAGSSGKILSLNPFEIICGSGTLQIQKIQTETEEDLSADEWLKKESNKSLIGNLL